jgi:hypothetical protein
VPLKKGTEVVAKVLPPVLSFEQGEGSEARQSDTVIEDQRRFEAGVGEKEIATQLWQSGAFHLPLDPPLRS